MKQTDKVNIPFQSIELRRELARLKLARWYSQILWGGKGVTALADWAERENKMELWSEEETEGRISHVGGSKLDERKTKSVMDGVAHEEKLVESLMIS